MNFIFQIVLLFSRIPLKFLYGIADVIFFINHYFVGYRKKVVFTNLQHSFPDKDENEIKEIRRLFFKNFVDYIVETAKSFTITSDELRIRVQHINQEVFHDAKKEGKNIIMLAGHVFNWEWFTALATIIPQENCYPVYRKMQSGFWEEKLRKIRNSHGNQSIEAHDVIKHIFRNPNDGNSTYMFVADQSPDPLSINYGIPFLHQKTPVFIGYDKLATRKDLVFVYCDMKKVKRGFYQVNYYRIYPDGEKFVELEVVQKFHHLLENTIHKRPDNYLWSHRKWKYADKIKTMVEQ